jgi:hypothetical protein
LGQELAEIGAKSEQSAPRVSSSTIDILKTCSRCRLLHIVCVNSSGKRISTFRALPVLVHTSRRAEGSRNALDLTVHLLFLPLLSAKERTRNEPSCCEFTKSECRESRPRRFLKRSIVVLLTLGADCSPFAPISASSSCFLPVNPPQLDVLALKLNGVAHFHRRMAPTDIGNAATHFPYWL